MILHVQHRSYLLRNALEGCGLGKNWRHNVWTCSGTGKAILKANGLDTLTKENLKKKKGRGD